MRFQTASTGASKDQWVVKEYLVRVASVESVSE